MWRKDKQALIAIVPAVLAIFFSGLAFTIGVTRFNDRRVVSECMDNLLAGYVVTTQNNGTVVYTKTEADAELEAQITDVIAKVATKPPGNDYSRVSVADWLVIYGQTVSNTVIVSRELPTVVYNGNSWKITFGQ